MRILLIALFALCAAVVVGHYVAADPGFIVIGYGGKVFRTTFAFFVLVLLALGLALYALVRIGVRMFGLRRRWRRWSDGYRQRRAYRSLTDGLMALAAGDYARAETLFKRGVDADTQPEVHYLAAAEAAAALNAPARRDNYLKLAHDVQPEAGAALDARRAAWLIENGELEEAGAVLDRLARGRPGTPQLLKLRHDYLRARGDCAALLALLPDLRRDRVIGFDALNALESECAQAVLAAPSASPAELDARWQALPKTARAQAAAVAAYARGLVGHAQHEAAEALVRRQLERSWDRDLAALYGEIACSPPARQLRRLENWAALHPGDPALKLARARVALRGQLWGQALSDLQDLVATAPTPLLHRLLADAHEGAGDAQAAARHRRLGLELATGGPRSASAA
jgi:HemY protein